MIVAACIILGSLAWLALGVFVGSGLRPTRDRQTPTPPPPPVHQVRDGRLDIRPALDRECDTRWN